MCRIEAKSLDDMAVADLLLRDFSFFLSPNKKSSALVSG